jgi:hypothetical protein
VDQDPELLKWRGRQSYYALRFTYREQPAIALGEVQRRLDNITDLLVLAGDDLTHDRWDDIVTGDPWRERADKRVELARERMRTRTRVDRLHYNPVLEISIAASIATATAIIALWKKYSLARVEASKSDIAESDALVAKEKADTVIARERLNQELIAVLRNEVQERGLDPLKTIADRPLNELLQNAVEAVILPKQIEGVDKNRNAIEI